MDQIKSFKQLRQEKNITQAELAELTGLSKAVISKYENGLIKPRGVNLTEIAKAFGVSVDELSDSLGVTDIKFIDFIDIPIAGSNGEKHVLLTKAELDQLNCNENDLYACIYKSNLMSPVINFGDIVVIDRSSDRPSEGSIIALNPIDKTLILRKVSLKSDGDVLLSVLDSSEPKETIKLEKLKIYGRVVLRRGFL